MITDRNLLFGVLAVQLRKVTPSQLVEAAAAWAAMPSKELPRRLVEMGVLTEADRSVLDRLVSDAIRDSGGDIKAALESLGGEHAVGSSFHGSIIRNGNDWAYKVNHDSVSGAAADGEISVREVPGRYREIAEQGRGGMGRVLLVHDEAVGRDIVLKELLPASDAEADTPGSPIRRSASLMQRFLLEARVTGQLEHPAIAPVYELGYRADGSLYYTMKLVRGRTLSRALDEAKNLRSRLALLPHFADLCQALAYAHNRGVIHRDLKPANVMIGEFGETVLLDWGLAKVVGKPDIQGDQLEATLKSWGIRDQSLRDNTAPGDVLGTPLYMAPEQARGEIGAIDRRSDIYSLGVILFHLVTGTTPFPWTNAIEVLKRVATDTPPRVEEVEPKAPLELAAICNRAMQRNPRDRYQSAKELADDILRYQSGALVKAYEYGYGEYLRRFVVRNRAILTTASIAVLALLGLGIYSYVRVSNERSVAVAARDEAEAQRKDADAQRKDADAQRTIAQENFARAEKNFQSARQAVDDLFTNVSENVLFDTPGVEPVRKDLLELALKYYEGFISEQAEDPSLRYELANTYMRVGRINKELGIMDKSAAAFDHAAVIFQQLASEDPAEPRYLRDLTDALGLEAQALYEAGQAMKAFQTATRALVVGDSLIERFPDDPEWKIFVGRGYVVYTGVHVASGNFPQALKVAEKAVALLEPLAMVEPGNHEYALELARAYRTTGEMRSRVGDLDGSLEDSKKALSLFEQAVGDAEMADPGARNELVEIHVEIGDGLMRVHKHEEAWVSYTTARSMGETLAEQFPSMIPYKQSLAIIYRAQADYAHHLKNLPQAIQYRRDTIRVGEEILDRATSSLSDQFWYSDDLIFLSQWLAESGEIDEPIATLNRVIELNKPAASENPGIIWPMAKIRWATDELAKIYARLGRHRDAMTAYEDLMAYNRQFLAIGVTEENRAERNTYLAGALNTFAWTLLTIEQKEFRDPAKAVTLAREAAELTGEKDAAILDTLGLAYFQSRDIRAAIVAQQKAIAQLDDKVDAAMRKELENRLIEFREASAGQAPKSQ